MKNILQLDGYTIFEYTKTTELHTLKEWIL